MYMKYLPPLLSIYLILVSGSAKGYFRNRLTAFLAADEFLKQRETLIRSVALDWSSRLGFFNAMFTAMVSVFSIYSESKSYEWAVGTFLVLLLVFIPTFWWIMGQEPDEIAARKMARINISPARFCSLILVVINLILIGAIAGAHRLTP